jgi:hypothetical protein
VSGRGDLIRRGLNRGFVDVRENHRRPASASAFAVASPSPVPVPVTSATLFVNDMFIVEP